MTASSRPAPAMTNQILRGTRTSWCASAPRSKAVILLSTWWTNTIRRLGHSPPKLMPCHPRFKRGVITLNKSVIDAGKEGEGTRSPACASTAENVTKGGALSPQQCARLSSPTGKSAEKPTFSNSASTKSPSAVGTQRSGAWLKSVWLTCRHRPAQVISPMPNLWSFTVPRSVRKLNRGKWFPKAPSILPRRGMPPRRLAVRGLIPPLVRPSDKGKETIPVLSPLHRRMARSGSASRQLLQRLPSILKRPLLL